MCTVEKNNNTIMCKIYQYNLSLSYHIVLSYMSPTLRCLSHMAICFVLSVCGLFKIYFPENFLASLSFKSFLKNSVNIKLTAREGPV